MACLTNLSCVIIKGNYFVLWFKKIFFWILDSVGTGCEIGVDYCRPDDDTGSTVCLNGGICHTIGDSFMCECVGGMANLQSIV